MNLRNPTIQDCEFLLECYADWPLTVETGIITLDKVSSWVQRWIVRNDEVVWIAEIDLGPVGLIKYHLENMPVKEYTPIDTEYVWHHAFRILEPLPKVVVDNLIVHPDHRGLGYSDTIAALAWDKVPDVVERAEFAVMEGAIRANIEQAKEKPQGTYELIGESIGETGTLITGSINRSTRK